MATLCDAFAAWGNRDDLRWRALRYTVTFRTRLRSKLRSAGTSFELRRLIGLRHSLYGYVIVLHIRGECFASDRCLPGPQDGCRSFGRDGHRSGSQDVHAQIQLPGIVVTTPSPVVRSSPKAVRAPAAAPTETPAHSPPAGHHRRGRLRAYHGGPLEARSPARPGPTWPTPSSTGRGSLARTSRPAPTGP